MKSRASGSLSAIRTLFSDPLSLRAGVRRFLGSPASVWLCGISFVLAGLAGISLSLVQGWTIYSTAMSSSAGDERLYNAVVVLMGFQVLLLSAGLLGLHVLLSKRYRWMWWFSVAGVLMAALSAIGYSAGALYESLAQPSYYSSWGVLNVLFFVGYFGQPVGAVLVGIAALWSRGLGRWRALPLVASLLGSPLSPLVLWWLLPPGDMLVPNPRETLVEALRFASPVALVGICWFSLGLTTFGIRKREAVALAKQRRTTDDRNLSLAHRLYEEAWGVGNVAVLDELTAPDFFDRRRGRHGSEELKRAILDLHRTFPDLDFSVEEQHADGDMVTTRCRFSGTDRGGLLWYPPTNKHADFNATYTDHFSNGKLLEHHGGVDKDDLLLQLGLTHQVGNDSS